MKKTTAVFVILALALAIALFSAKVAYAGNTPTGRVTISGFAPAVSDVIVWNEHGADANITMTTGQLGAVVTANATITDYDGRGDITGASAVFYLTGSSGESDNENNHASDGSCTLINGTGAYDKNATCSFTLGYMALPGTWIVNITATDGTHSGSGTANRDVSTLLALDVLTSTIEFGEMSPGGNSTDPANVTVQNLGNLVLGTNYSGTDYTCAVGSIDVGNTKYNNTALSYTAMTTALTIGPVQDPGFSLAVRTGGTNATDLEFFTILIPSSGAIGLCQNTVTIDAV